MVVDCIPHALIRHAPHAVHAAARHHHHPRAVIVKAKVVSTHPEPRRHVRLRECPPNALVAPLADLDNDNVASIYMAPYGAPGGGPVSDESAPTRTDAAPAKPSGLDLPVGETGVFGGSGGGGDVIGLPSGGGGSGGGSGGGGSGGSAGGGGSGGSAGGGGETSGGTGGSGGAPGGGPVIVVPPGGGGGVMAVPEPATWTLMLIGVGGIGGLMRRDRRLTLSA